MAGGYRETAVDRLELVARDLASISRVRPEVGALLEDVGVMRNLQRAMELLTDSDG